MSFLSPPLPAILDLPEEIAPFISFVHANSHEEALERVVVFGKNLLAVPADAPMESMTSAKITRHFLIYGRSRETTNHLFYRQTGSRQAPLSLNFPQNVVRLRRS